MQYKRLLKAAVVAVIIAVLGFYIQLDYFLIRPSRAVDLRDLISVENAVENDRGAIYLLTVTQHRATPLTVIYGYFHPYIDINPAERVIPRDMSEEEYRELLAENMIESRHLAQVVALRRSGYEVDIISDGVEIVGFVEDAPAEGILQEGDLILSVDGTPVFLATEVPLLVQAREVGEKVSLTVTRNSEDLELLVPTGEHPDDPDMPFLGIFIKTLPWEPVIPLEVKMETGRIGGPSAGLMFVLEIMNQLTSVDLTGGYDIAGTGTIDLNEKVGRIGGVKQKVIAAEKAGADIFFVPEGNHEAALKVATEAEIVPVSELEEVLQYLEELRVNSSLFMPADFDSACLKVLYFN
ncbi:MAG: YlbL family protein [Bacillota bacterium]